MGNEGSVDLYFDGGMGHSDAVGSGSSAVTPHFHSPFCQGLTQLVSLFCAHSPIPLASISTDHVVTSRPVINWVRLVLCIFYVLIPQLFWFYPNPVFTV